MQLRRIDLLSEDERRVLFMRVAASSSAIEGYHDAAKRVRKEARALEKKLKLKSTPQKLK